VRLSVIVFWFSLDLQNVGFIIYQMNQTRFFSAASILCFWAGVAALRAEKTGNEAVMNRLGPGGSLFASWEVQTLDTKLRFVLHDGRPVISELRAVTSTRGSAPHNWIRESEEVELPAAVEINFHKQNIQFEYVGASTGERQVSFAYRSSSPDLELVSTRQSVPGHGPIEHMVALTNNSDKPLIFFPTPTIAFAVLSDRAKELWWVEQSEAAPSDSGTHVESIGPDYVKSLLTGPNISPKGQPRDAIPWLCLHDPEARLGLYGGIEFSGFTEIAFRKRPDGSLSVELGLDPRGGKTRSRIKPGDAFQFPTCFVGTYTGEVDDGCNQLHRWVEKHLRPPASGPVPMLGNNTWSPSEIRFDINDTKARAMVDNCHDLGIELFEVDAGWFTTAGDWNEDPEKFPAGLGQVSAYAHSKGIKFGLWIAWAHGTCLKDSGPNVLSPLNPVHKPWFTCDYPANWRRKVPWEGAPVCLGCPEAGQWCLDLLRRIITNYRLDVLRQDQIVVVESCAREEHDHIAHDPVDVSRSAALGYYEIYDQLRREFPHLLFEGCNGGGRMADFGFLKRVHYYQLEDSYVPINTRRAFYDASFPFPQTMLLQWIRTGPAGQTLTGFKYWLRSAMLGWCSIQIDITKWNVAQRKVAKRQFELYKERIRPLIASANLYHVLPRPDGKTWDGIEYFDPESGNGVLFVFRPETDLVSKRIVLRGLNVDEFYSVTAIDGSIEDRRISGKELLESGLTLSLPEQNSSDLVFFAEVRK